MSTDAREPAVARVFSCPHIPARTIRWGIASNKEWCPKCKTWVHASIDWEGHP